MSASTTQAVTAVLVTVDMNWILMKSLALVRNIIIINSSINILFSTYQDQFILFYFIYLFYLINSS